MYINFGKSMWPVRQIQHFKQISQWGLSDGMTFKARIGPIEISESKDLRFHTAQFVWLSNRRQQNSNSFLGVWWPLLGTIDQSSTQWLKLLSPKIIHRSFRVFLFTCAKLWPFPIRQEYQALSVCNNPRRKLTDNYCCWFSTLLKRCGTANFWVVWW